MRLGAAPLSLQNGGSGAGAERRCIFKRTGHGIMVLWTVFQCICVWLCPQQQASLMAISSGCVTFDSKSLGTEKAYVSLVG